MNLIKIITKGQQDHYNEWHYMSTMKINEVQRTLLVLRMLAGTWPCLQSIANLQPHCTKSTADIL